MVTQLLVLICAVMRIREKIRIPILTYALICGKISLVKFLEEEYRVRITREGAVGVSPLMAAREGSLAVFGKKGCAD